MSPRRSLHRALRAMTDAAPHRVAIVADGRALTYRDFQHAIGRASSVLRGTWSVGAGDRVAYLGSNSVDELVLLFALARVGGVFVPLNTRLTTVELAAIVAHAEPRVVVTDAAFASLGTAAVSGRAARRSIDELSMPSSDGSTFGDDVDADAPLLLAYTSGTTGTPKGALHTHAALLANAAASIAAHAMTPDDRVLSVLPLFHVGGLCIQTVPALLAGATVVLHPRFDADAWLAAIATMRPTLTLMVPATLRAVIGHHGWARTDLSCLRVLMTGSSIVPRPLIDAVHARGVPVGQIYGSTETGPVSVALGAARARDKAGFAGWPCFPASVRVVDAAGAEVVDGTVGEVLVRAPNVMRGYWREPAGAGFRDGWFATGDLGRFDDEGCLAIVGRSRDLIISGGENIHPAEVEGVLASLPGVAEVAVIGVPDERWGEVPAAFIVRSDGNARQVDESTIRTALADRLARYKWPKRVVFVDALPRNAMGKVQADRLRSWW